MSISPNRLEELQNIPDGEIDTSDIPELDRKFWETAKRNFNPFVVQDERQVLDKSDDGLLAEYHFDYKKAKPNRFTVQDGKQVVILDEVAEK